jgi:hypothetical protein
VRAKPRGSPGASVLARNRRVSLQGETIPKPTLVHGAVAILDVLGLKEQTTPEFLRLLHYHTVGEKGYLTSRERSLILDLSQRSGVVHPKRGPLPPETETHMFQDSLVVFTTGRPPYRRLVDHLLVRLMDTFRDALKDGILFRGVISVGSFYFLKPLILAGPAFYEAIAWHERPDWAGISLTPSALYAFEHGRHLGFNRGLATRYDVPLKGGGTVDTYALNWAARFDREELVAIFSEMTVTPDTEGKYRNTLAFYDHERPDAREEVDGSEVLSVVVGETRDRLASRTRSGGRPKQK